jgi:FMN-binding domain
MRRAIPAAIATVIGLGALATFKTSPGVSTKTSSGLGPKGGVPAAAPPRGTTPTTHGSVRTIDGDPFANPYGTVQVRVTLRGTRITDVTPLQMPVDRQYSAELSQQAAPLLLQEALQAQSAQINILSGASYTSQSYAQSLQSALDKAH